MDHFSRLILNPFLLLGGICLVVAVVSTCSGKALTRGQGFVARAEEPGTFWWLVAMWYIGGILLIGSFFYKNFS
jgi:hypothetical protein